MSLFCRILTKSTPNQHLVATCKDTGISNMQQNTRLCIPHHIPPPVCLQSGNRPEMNHRVRSNTLRRLWAQLIRTCCLLWQSKVTSITWLTIKSYPKFLPGSNFLHVILSTMFTWTNIFPQSNLLACPSHALIILETCLEVIPTKYQH